MTFSGPLLALSNKLPLPKLLIGVETVRLSTAVTEALVELKAERRSETYSVLGPVDAAVKSVTPEMFVDGPVATMSMLSGSSNHSPV